MAGEFPGWGFAIYPQKSTCLHATCLFLLLLSSYLKAAMCKSVQRCYIRTGIQTDEANTHIFCNPRLRSRLKLAGLQCLQSSEMSVGKRSRCHEFLFLNLNSNAFPHNFKECILYNLFTQPPNCRVPDCSLSVVPNCFCNNCLILISCH